MSLKEISELIKLHPWVSVDNFFPHLANLCGRRGIVIWGQSDYNLFGWKNNINLLKDRKYLRPNQFGTWEEAVFNKEAFVDPDVVINAIMEIVKID